MNIWVLINIDCDGAGTVFGVFKRSGAAKLRARQLSLIEPSRSEFSIEEWDLESGLFCGHYYRARGRWKYVGNG